MSWKLEKALRGLRAVPRSWQERLAHLMRRHGFARLQSRASVCANLMFAVIALVHVDGLMAVGSQSSASKILRACLFHCFSIRLEAWPRKTWRPASEAWLFFERGISLRQALKDAYHRYSSRIWTVYLQGRRRSRNTLAFAQADLRRRSVGQGRALVAQIDWLKAFVAHCASL